MKDNIPATLNKQKCIDKDCQMSGNLMVIGSFRDQDKFLHLERDRTEHKI